MAYFIIVLVVAALATAWRLAVRRHRSGQAHSRIDLIGDSEA